MFCLRVSRSVKTALQARLPEKVASAASELITTVLLDDPRRVGKRLLHPPYVGTWSARRGIYRVLYEIDDVRRVVTVTSVKHRTDAYRSR